MDATYTTESDIADLTDLAVPDLLVGIGPLLAGIAVVVFLVLAAVYGLRLLRREGGSHSRHAAASGPRRRRPRGRVREEGVGASDEMPHDGRRRSVHEIGDEERGAAPPTERRPHRPGRDGGGGAV